MNVCTQYITYHDVKENKPFLVKPSEILRYVFLNNRHYLYKNKFYNIFDVFYVYHLFSVEYKYHYEKHYFSVIHHFILIF